MAELNRFTPADWYWKVATVPGQVYSSKTGAFVPENDEAYQGWLSFGRLPTKIDSEASLGDVLAQYAAPAPASAGAVRDAYLEQQATKLPVEIIFKILFNHENRIRTLAGQQQITAAQFKAAIKALI